MTEEEFYKIINPEILQAISKFENENPSSLALKLSKRKNWPTRAIAEQVDCRKKGRTKIPGWVANGALLDKTALQQASSEATARYKGSFSECRGRIAIDLTGGLGIDTAVLSGNFRQFFYIDLNPVMCHLARFNFDLAGLSNITVKNGDGLQILSDFQDNYFDLLYVDPSRRVNGHRVISLTNSVPDIAGNLDLLKRKAKYILLKLSPMMDITETIRLLPGVSYIDVVSYDDECKEILVMLKTGYSGAPVIRATRLTHSGEIYYQLQQPSNKSLRGKVTPVKKYLYYPDPAFIKTDMIDCLGETLNLSRIHPSVVFLTSDNQEISFPGKSYQALCVITAHTRDVRDYLKNEDIRKANIITRGFPESPDSMYRRLKLKHGGNDYLFFTTAYDDQYIMIHAVAARTSFDL